MGDLFEWKVWNFDQKLFISLIIGFIGLIIGYVKKKV